MIGDGSLRSADQPGTQQDGGSSPSSLFRLPLIEWLPDETVFSLCSRLHFLSGHHVPAKTSSLLFGSPRSGSAHDIPAHLQSLVSRVPNLGKAHDVVVRHTLLPFYFPFHETHRCLAWIEQVVLGTAPNLKAQLGIASSRFGASHPLKACAECMDADVRQHGVAYWHVSHQLPGVLVCPSHQTALQSTRIKVSGEDRFGWALPAEVSFTLPPQGSAFSAEASDLAKASLALHALPAEFFFECDRLATLYMRRMVEMGWTRRNDLTVVRSAFEPKLSRFLQDSFISTAWPWTISGQGVHTMAERLIRISRGSRSRESRHPLNHLILQLLLFGDWDSFLKEYQHAPSSLPHRQEQLPGGARHSDLSVSQQSEDRRARLLARMREGASATQAANEFGVTVATAMTWACGAGVAPSRRPKLLKEPVLRPLIKALSNGQDKQRAAKAFGLSIQTITRVLLTEPGLHQRWSIARFKKEQARCRSAWKLVMTSMPCASSVIWRKLEPAAYAWLYRNDRAWLQEAIAGRQQPPSISHTRRDWTARDQLLSQLVKKAGFDWLSVHPHGHPTLAKLCSQVQGLRQVLPALHKLPLTQLSIREVCLTRRSGTSPQSQSMFVAVPENT